MSRVYNYNGDKGGLPVVTNGRISLAPRDENGVAGAFKSVTYFSQAGIALSTTPQPLFSSIKGVRSLADEFISERSGTLNITLQSAHAENLKIALFATSNKLSASAGTDETIAVKVYTDGTNRLGNRFILSLTEVTDGDLITYEEGKNYVIEYSTIYILSVAEQTAAGAANIIDDGDVIEITGKFMETIVLNGFTVDKIETAMIFTGFNISKGQKNPLELYCPRLSFLPSSFDLLSDAGFGTISLSASILPDETIQGTDSAGNDLSQYFEYRTTK